MEKEILAAYQAVTHKPDWLTNDKLEAAMKGHGVLVMPALAVGNSVAADLKRGLDIKLDDAAAMEIDLDIIIERAVKAAIDNGASPENAALLVAATVYLAGSGARAGVPMANRKVGATARIAAGASRTSAIALQTNKFTNRLTAFPAYMAIYNAIMEKKATSVDGAKLPLFLSGGAIYGHASLAEDHMVPELAKNLAKIGAEAMRTAFEGAGLTPSPLWCALLAAAVTMEIVHPDAFAGEEYGPFGNKMSSYFAGLGAVEGSGLPPKIHWRGTNEEVDTADIIGDFGLILKDIGGPSLIGSMALNEMFAGFQEAPLMYAGFSGGPVNPPSGHLNSDVAPIIRLLMQNGWDVDDAAAKMREYKFGGFIDPEMALAGINNVARKAEQANRGFITDVMIKASQPVMTRAISRRLNAAFEMIKGGKNPGEVAKKFDEERLAYVEARGSAILTWFLKMLGVIKEGVTIKFTELRPQARRCDKFTAKYWGFDSYISYDLVIDGKEYHIENLSSEATIDFVLKGKNADDPMYVWVLFCGNVVAQELQYIGFSIMNITVPAAIAAALGQDPKEAAKSAEKGAYLSCAIPGARDNAFKVAKLAKELSEWLKMEKHDVLPAA
jgi:methylthioribose-1-phosphate isomerase